LNNDGSLSGAEVFRQSRYGISGDNAVMYGAMGTDGDGDMFMVLNWSGDTIDPSLLYASRRLTGIFSTLNYLAQGAAPYSIGNAGFYTALSPSGVPFTDDVWLSGAFANANGDWSTEIAHLKFVKGQS
jgi:hypothetical protein